ncbi:uncharacterized protein LOC134203983 [Armigeres subalbatus]|uniref:uncharacterized protein LOC134203983 n=1 Tax=Armigeres subalbatus TaxID=124917 RepID=UPI002ED0D496
MDYGSFELNPASLALCVQPAGQDLNDDTGERFDEETFEERLIETDEELAINDLDDADFNDDIIEELLTDDEASPSKNPKTQLSCCLEIHQRLFKQKKKTEAVESCTIDADDVDHFFRKVWRKCVKHVRKEIAYQPACNGEDAIAEWVTNQPTFSDKNRFIVFHDKDQKKSFTCDQITEKLLSKWRGRTIHVLVHPYSLSIVSQKDYDFVCNRLLNTGAKDRAGADTNLSLMTLVAKLKRMNNHRYEATESAYVQWANYIQHAPAHTREELLDGEPPKQYANLFTEINGPTAAKCLNAVKSDAGIAENILDRFDTDFVALKQQFDKIVNAVDDFRKLLTEMDQRRDERKAMLTMMKNAVAVQETDFSRSVAELVTDVPDVDHI